jgi:hypothetical protein
LEFDPKDAILIRGADKLDRERKLEGADQDSPLDLAMEIGAMDRRTIDGQEQMISHERQVDVALDHAGNGDLQVEMAALLDQVQQGFDQGHLAEWS